MQPKEIPAGEFKQHCLRLMDEVASNRTPIIVTKRGKPVAKLVPAEDMAGSSFGALAGTMAIQGDLLAPLDVEWEADAPGAH